MHAINVVIHELANKSTWSSYGTNKALPRIADESGTFHRVEVLGPPINLPGLGAKA